MFQKLGKITATLLMANLLLWVYFWTAFALAAEPYDPRPWGHYPVDLYCLWGSAIGLTKSALMYPFMKAIFWTELPSFWLVTLIQRTLFSKVSADAFLFGISTGGYKLLVIMALSFFQWYLVGRLIQKLTKRDALPSSVPGS